MGAWGTGPFDSDGALDYLDDLEAWSGAARNKAGEIEPASVNRAVVLEQLRRTLAGASEQAGRGWSGSEELIYAAAGLVAARLTDQSPADTGTGLIPGIRAGQGFPQNLGLDRHCGHLGLLDWHTAQLLQGIASRAVAALRADRSWHGEWRTPARLVAQLERLARALAPERHSDRGAGPEPEPGP
jgi:hypothetical protein